MLWPRTEKNSAILCFPNGNGSQQADYLMLQEKVCQGSTNCGK